MQKLGACIALYKMIPKIQSQAAISAIISNIRSSGTHVVLVFAVEQDVARLFDEAVRYALYLVFVHTQTTLSMLLSKFS